MKVLVVGSGLSAYGACIALLDKNKENKLKIDVIDIGLKNSNRVWVHTCTLDHPNAIENYKSRGMKIFKTEILKRRAI